MTARANKPSNSDIENPPPPPPNEEAPGVPRYEAIAELLREARTSCEGAGDESLIFMVDVAYRICQACCCAWNEVESHRQAYSNAHQRQLQLLQELSVLIDLISVPAVRNKYRNPSFPDLAGTDRGQSVTAVSTEYERLVQRIKDLLGPLPISEIVSQDASSAAENGVERILVQGGEITALTPDPLNTEVGVSAKLARPSLAIYFLSLFRVLLDEQPVGGWPNCKGKSIFKYLVTHRERPIPKEVLMEIFWPEVDPDAARNNLNVAIYGLRKALSKVNTDFSYVLFQDGCYLLNPELHIWVDAEAFMASNSR